MSLVQGPSWVLHSAQSDWVCGMIGTHPWGYGSINLCAIICPKYHEGQWSAQKVLLGERPTKHVLEPQRIPCDGVALFEFKLAVIKWPLINNHIVVM